MNIWGEQFGRLEPCESCRAGYRLVFFTVVGLTLVSGLGEITMAAVWTNPTADQQSAFEAIDFAWKAGIGVIFGLFGGKIM
jgi:hypothetical protein